MAATAAVAMRAGYTRTATTTTKRCTPLLPSDKAPCEGGYARAPRARPSRPVAAAAGFGLSIVEWRGRAHQLAQRVTQAQPLSERLDAQLLGENALLHAAVKPVQLAEGAPCLLYTSPSPRD